MQFLLITINSNILFTVFSLPRINIYYFRLFIFFKYFILVCNITYVFTMIKRAFYCVTHVWIKQVLLGFIWSICKISQIWSMLQIFYWRKVDNISFRNIPPHLSNIVKLYFESKTFCFKNADFSSWSFFTKPKITKIFIFLNQNSNLITCF